MHSRFLPSAAMATLLAAAGLAVAPAAVASNPLEYPDNGSASFSRGGAWLATATDPIATHYNPAALATQASGFSLEQQLNFNKVCFDRRGPGNTVTGPDAAVTLPADPSRIGVEYRPVCTERGSFPSTVPSIAITWRATRQLGIGFAIVPPAAYGSPDDQFSPTAKGYSNFTDKEVTVPAPYRYMALNQQSTIVLPTLGIGYEVFKSFRVGLAFVAGIASINVQTAGVSNLKDPIEVDAKGDHWEDDSHAWLRTRDLFVPGVIGAIHWSVLPQLDVALWGRWMDSITTSEGEFDVTTSYYIRESGNFSVAPACNGVITPTGETSLGECATGNGVVNKYKDALKHFKYPIPAEVRAGVRFHLPRADGGKVGIQLGNPVRDPLKDDVFDVELDGSFTMNGAADTIEVRFAEADGKGTKQTQPTGVYIPPNADRATGYQDSYGVRLGGQWNVLPERLGLRAGGWYETQSQKAEFLTMFPVGAARWGMGGGLVVRQDFIDISIGYQRHLSAGLNNNGNGASKASAGTTGGPEFDLDNEPPGVKAQDRTQFRTVHAVNGGRVTQNAHVFTLGGVLRF